jgi:hypothetical protein
MFGPCRGVTLKTSGAAKQFRELGWRVEISHRKFVVEEELEVAQCRLDM